MSIEQISESSPALFSELTETPPAPSRVKSARSANRAASWERDLAQTASYLMGQARTDDERAFIGRLYEEAEAEGPDFTKYRSKSAFMNAPKLGIDRNAYARILNALDLIERGTYDHCREKGKQGIPRTAARVLKALLNLALKFDEVRPSQLGLAKLARCCKQTVVNCLKVLQLYGFIEVHRRIKRIRTPLGLKVVQDTNAYTIREPRGLGSIALNLFRQASESKKWPASSKDSSFNRVSGAKFGASDPIQGGLGPITGGVGSLLDRALAFRHPDYCARSALPREGRGGGCPQRGRVSPRGLAAKNSGPRR